MLKYIVFPTQQCIFITQVDSIAQRLSDSHTNNKSPDNLDQLLSKMITQL